MWFIFYHHLSLSKLYEHLCFLIGLKKQKKTLNTPCLKKNTLRFEICSSFEIRSLVTKICDNQNARFDL